MTTRPKSVLLLGPVLWATALAGCGGGGSAGLRWQRDRIVDGDGRIVRLKRLVFGQLEDEVLRRGAGGRIVARLVRSANDHSSPGCVRYDDNPGEQGPTCAQDGIIAVPLEWYEADDRYRHDAAGHPIERIRKAITLDGFEHDAPGSPGPRLQGMRRTELVRWGWRGDQVISVRVLSQGQEVNVTSSGVGARLTEEALHVWALAKGQP